MSDEHENLPEVGPWATEKLDRLRKYLSAYTEIMKKQKWTAGYVYIDAFAAAGKAVVRRSAREDDSPLLDLDLPTRQDDESRQVLDGSPRLALGIPHPFTHYVFVERDPQRLALLRALEREYAGRRDIRIREGDCNSYLLKVLTSTGIGLKPWRGVVFLDPFGMQVPWSTIERLAATKKFEVFINFPVGMAIQRLLKRSGSFTERERRKLDQYFGDPGWFDTVYEQARDLFGGVVRKADDSAVRLLEWYRGRLRNAFGFASDGYLVRNSRGGHLYYLIFAGPNKTGVKIANDVLTGGERVRNTG